MNDDIDVDTRDSTDAKPANGDQVEVIRDLKVKGLVLKIELLNKV